MHVLREIARVSPAPLRARIERYLKSRERRAIAMSYYQDKLDNIAKWSWRDTEHSNFYYKLTPLNRDHLAQLISVITGKPYSKIESYFDELENDEELRSHIETSLKSTNYARDIQVNYARRVGWYAFVRVMKPKVVIETGIEHGVGSCVLASAILRNAKEGHQGQYFGTEIRPEAGQLFTEKYAEAGRILYGDSITSLMDFKDEIDIFINDSDHSADYEYREYQAVLPKLAKRAVILGDNAHVTDSLSRFSKEHGRKFVFFSEKPSDHWYPGAGVGISYR